MAEIWRDVKGYEGKYLVSNYGRIKGVRSQKIRSFSDNGYGYYVISLTLNGSYKRHKVHRLVASAFVPNPNNFPVVNHLDGNKHNNNASNLEWTTQSENLKHAYRMGLKPFTEKQRTASSKSMRENTMLHERRVACVDIFGNEIVFRSVQDAANAVGRTKAAIVRCCKGKTDTCAGREWRYVDEHRLPRKREKI